jgi:hypothetical protein
MSSINSTIPIIIIGASQVLFFHQKVTKNREQNEKAKLLLFPCVKLK